MIHRPFIFKSFQSTAHAHTRRTCVSAAMTILREHRAITDFGELSLWTHTAFCITAATILSFEVMCDRQSLNDKRITYIDNILGARRRLSERVNDVLAQRGVLLIDAICPEADGTSSLHNTRSTSGATVATISFEEIVARLTTDWAILGLTSEIHAGEKSLVPQNPIFEDNFASGFEEFDTWFHQMFSGGLENSTVIGL